MKKLLSTLAIAMTFASIASADFARVEMGGGLWQQTPSGDIGYSSNSLGFADASSGTAQSEAYAWLLVKHPIPVIPNIRLEYVSALNNGEYTIKAGTIGVPTGTKTELKLTQYDIVPYYNILDNTAWITLDLGVDVKLVQLGYTAAGVDIINKTGVSIAAVTVPLGYVRARVQAPLMNWGVEADVKYITYDSNTVSDMRFKVDYTFDFVPIVQPAIELGYRIQKFDLSKSGFAINTEYKGVYAGLMLRF